MDLKIETFYITFDFFGKKYKAMVQQTSLNATYEKFTVTGGKKSFEITSDRPEIRNAGGKRKIKMQAKGIDTFYKENVEDIIRLIQDHIYKIEHPPFDWTTHPKNK